jgi:hypothetical protein
VKSLFEGEKARRIPATCEWTLIKHKYHKYYLVPLFQSGHISHLFLKEMGVVQRWTKSRAASTEIHGADPITEGGDKVMGLVVQVQIS